MESKEGKSLPSTLYTEEYFLTACEGYDVFLESEGKHLSRRLQDAFEKAEVAAGMRLLDVGCGRGEIIRHCMRLGVEAYGIDYAEVAAQMTANVIEKESEGINTAAIPAGVCLADAKRLPFPSGYFDRILLFDVVEHLYPWELDRALHEIRRVLSPDGKLVIHTAPNRWYDTYAYPIVRFGRRLIGQGDSYPKNPRTIIPANEDVHVNEQDMRSLNQTLKKAGFIGKVWLDSPPRTEAEGIVIDTLHWVAFSLPPFRWFFERELFAVARKS
ncbi:MAG: class I SAM-dependent methyltransferase [Candidatus Promineifilaceae bacterium]